MYVIGDLTMLKDILPMKRNCHTKIVFPLFKGTEAASDGCSDTCWLNTNYAVAVKVINVMCALIKFCHGQYDSLTQTTSSKSLSNLIRNAREIVKIATGILDVLVHTWKIA